MTQQGQRNMFHKDEWEYASLEFIIARNLVSVLSEGLLRKRYALFEKHISSMKGDAREKICECDEPGYKRDKSNEPLEEEWQ